MMGPEDKIVKEINSFIERYDSKVDKHYVLFLFQIYNYSDGVQGCCERLDLKQELLSYYIQNKQAEKVLEIVKEEVKEVIVTPTVVTVDTTKGEIIKPFCDKCDSKGVRHKKVCPLYTVDNKN